MLSKLVILESSSEQKLDDTIQTVLKHEQIKSIRTWAGMNVIANFEPVLKLLCHLVGIHGSLTSE